MVAAGVMSCAAPEFCSEFFPKRTTYQPEEKATPPANSYCETPASSFLVRGPHYLDADGSKFKKNNKDLKVPSAAATYSLVGLQCFSSSKRMPHGAEKIQPLREFLQAGLSEESAESIYPQFLIFTWLLANGSGTEFTSVVHLCKRTFSPGDDPVFDRTFLHFVEGDDECKRELLKMAFRIVRAPMGVKATVGTLGGERPVLIAKRLATEFFTGRNYIEVDMDVGSSTVASKMKGMICTAAGHIVGDQIFLIEGTTSGTLPERALVSLRWNYTNVNACTLPLTDDGVLIDNPDMGKLALSDGEGSTNEDGDDEYYDTASLDSV
jgi:hypothetical protein